jgi:flavin reductase (DIM6/NTAB) family NADH-FMN oxidoreductase RutF
MFETALQTERALGLNYWEQECPKVDGIAFSLLEPNRAEVATKWAARLDWPAQSVDQRLKIPRWMDEFESRGGTLLVGEAGLDDLEQYSQNHDLVIIATGRGALGNLFARDSEKSRFNAPQRALALTYVTGMVPRPEFSAVCFSITPGIGEYFVFPALTSSGVCEIMVFEGIPGGPMDCWNEVHTHGEHLDRSLEILEQFFPHEAARCDDVELTDPQGTLTGRLTPVVRRPAAVLPSGAAVMGMADAVVLNDPITGQGSNHAAKCADTYLVSIQERIANGDAFDLIWMQQTFDRYWRGYAQWAVAWTNSMLLPPQPHVLRVLHAAAELPSLATTIVNGFDDPRVFFPWWFDESEADHLIAGKQAQARERFDQRDLRRALGQFATGVTVITTCAEDGHRVGVTANSFTSLSLDPPLVLWCLSKVAPSRSAFEEASHFAVNVLAASQHYLSRQFATPAEDKFSGVNFEEGPGGVPVIDGALAHFVCRNVRQLDGGDHLILIGEVERFSASDGEPLVFHSGAYRVATRHPELEPS